MRCAFATGLMAAAVVVTGCGSSELSASGPDEPAGTTRIIRQAMPAHEPPPKHTLRGCFVGSAVYCGGSKSSDVTIEPARGMQVVPGMPPVAALADGSALGAGGRVVFRGHDRGGVAYIVGRSGLDGLIARFPHTGLGHGGRAIVRLWCDHGTPMPILEQPSGRRVRPDLEVITSIPDTPEGRKLAVPDVCG